jgi:hypothetical protein
LEQHSLSFFVPPLIPPAVFTELSSARRLSQGNGLTGPERLTLAEEIMVRYLPQVLVIGNFLSSSF